MVYIVFIIIIYCIHILFEGCKHIFDLYESGLPERRLKPTAFSTKGRIMVQKPINIYSHIKIVLRLSSFLNILSVEATLYSIRSIDLNQRS